MATAMNGTMGPIARRGVTARRAALALALLWVAGAPDALVRAQTEPCAADRYLTYPLSYVESGHATALLTTLGYQVIEYKADASTAAVKCRDQSRPVVLKLLDSSNTGLVTDSTIAKTTTGAPQQRLLIVWRDPARLERLLGLLHGQVDVPARQILIEALVIELDTDEARNLGVAYGGEKDGAILQFNASGGGELSLGVSRPAAKTVLEFTATLDALVSDGTAEVLSRPSVLVLDGHVAKITVGDKLPFTQVLSSGLDVEKSIISSTKYLEVAITLTLRPRASQDETEVTMQVLTDISSPTGTSTITSSGAVVPPPVAKRNVASHVRVANNTPFVIAGLIRASRELSEAGIPFLSKIPGIGKAFKRTTRNRTQKEVIVVIIPHIIRAEDDSFSYSISKDSELLDQFDLTLFRNIYRLRSGDIFDLHFIRDSAFFQSLGRAVLVEAEELYRKLAPDLGLPPVASGNRAALARQLREVQELQPRQAPAEPFLQLLEGGIPGEDKLVKRMLIEIVEKDLTDELSKKGDYSKLMALEKILYYPVSSTSTEDETQVILDIERLTKRVADLGRGDCETLSMSYEVGKTSTDLPFDAPTAKLSTDRPRAPASLDAEARKAFEQRVSNLSWPPKTEDDYRAWMRALNVLGDDGLRWKSSTILLNKCPIARGGRSPLDHLKSVLVLKHLLDLNPDLLTLEAFHVGRELIFPTAEQLKHQSHLIDRQTAALFFETLEYYYSFEQSFRRVLTSGGAVKGALDRLEAGAAPPSAPPPVEEPGEETPDTTTDGEDSEAALARLFDAPPVRIVVRWGPGGWKAPAAQSPRLATAEPGAVVAAGRVRLRVAPVAPD